MMMVMVAMMMMMMMIIMIIFTISIINFSLGELPNCHYSTWSVW